MVSPWENKVIVTWYFYIFISVETHEVTIYMERKCSLHGKKENETQNVNTCIHKAP